MKSRRRMAALVIGAVAASSVGGWVAGSRIRSPAEVAARTAPPAASPILVPVESRVLSTDIVTRGTARFGSPEQLAVAPTALKANAGVVDTLPPTGAELTEGDTALTASGRPVFLLQGNQPAFRDLGPGISGQDVLQVEEALERMGFDPGAVDGAYDDATEVAVAAWYSAKGYAPAEATGEQLASIRALETDLAGARLEIITAQDTVVTAQSTLAAAQAAQDAAAGAAAAAPAAIANAEEGERLANESAAAEVAAKQAVLDSVRTGPPSVPATTAEIATAEANLQMAKANAETTKLAGGQAVAAAQAVLDGAAAGLSAAEAEAAANTSAADAAVTTAQAALDALRRDPAAPPSDVAAAEQDLDAAVANAASVRLAGAQTVAAARAVVDNAPGALAAAKTEASANNTSAASTVTAEQAVLDALKAGTPGTPGTAAEIAVAEADLSVAVANAESVRLAGATAVADANASASAADVNLTTTATDVENAQRALDLAAAAEGLRYSAADIVGLDLDLAQRRAGVQLPADEVIFVTSVPVRVAEVKVARSDPAAGVVMSVTDAAVAIDGSLALDDATLVTAGMPVLIDEPDLGIQASGVVSRVAEGPGTNGADGFHIYFEVQVQESPPALVGASVRLTVAVESSGGVVVAVPTSALVLAPDGSSQVQVERNGTLEAVVVEPGLAAGGYVGVTPTEGVLEVGELVVVGFEQPGSTPGA